MIKNQLKKSSLNDSNVSNSLGKKPFPKSLTVFIPENLDLDNLIEEHPPTGIKAFDKDKLAYIINLINYLPTTKKDYDYNENEGYVCINKQILQSQIHDYRKYINYLSNCGIIFESTFYIPGQKSQGLCLYPEYAYMKVREYKITRYTLIKAILKPSQKHIPMSKCEIGEHELFYILRWWETKKLSVDDYAAKKFLNDKLEKDKLAFKERYHSDDYEAIQKQNLSKKKNYRIKIKYPIYQYNSAFMTMSRLQTQGDFYLFKKDETAGRVHTILTQLPKTLRQFITYNGKNLVSIDLRNSQPLLATILLKENLFLENPILLENISLLSH